MHRHDLTSGTQHVLLHVDAATERTLGVWLPDEFGLPRVIAVAGDTRAEHAAATQLSAAAGETWEEVVAAMTGLTLGALRWRVGPALPVYLPMTAVLAELGLAPAAPVRLAG